MKPNDAGKMFRLCRFVQIVGQGGVLTEHLHRLLQHVGGEYGGSGEGVAFRHDSEWLEAADNFTGKLLSFQKGKQGTLIAVRKPDDGEGSAAQADVPDGVHCPGLPIVHGQRPSFCVFCKKGGKGRMDIPGLRHTDLQGEASMFLFCAEMLQRLVLPHGLFGEQQKFSSPVRGNHSSGASCEDGKTNLILQFTDIPAQIGLTDEKLLCRSCDGAVFFHLYGIAKHIQIHVFLRLSILRCILFCTLYTKCIGF